MAGGEAVAARPPRLGLRGNAGDARPSDALGARSNGRRWLLARLLGAQGKEKRGGL
jgi:hypothetical protein